MGVRENKVERYLDDQVKNRGGLTRKWVSPGRDGVPDRVVRLSSWPPGVVWFVEVKTDDGVLSKVQEREQARLIDSGCLVATVYGNTGVDKLMEMIK